MNKREAWENLKFDALFHGDDWKGSPLYDKYIEEFMGTGVKLFFLPHTDGTSSTTLSAVLNNALKK